MSWIRESTLNWFQTLCANILKSGNIPKHVAFIMDGNRRFAAKNKVKKNVGHDKGFDKLTELMKWCIDLGITEVTVYAFSTENYNRSPEEVDGIFYLSKQKSQLIINDSDKLEKIGICIRVFGNMDMLPLDLRQLLAEVVLVTRNNNKCFLNVAFAYTAREEMAGAVGEVASGVTQGWLLGSDVCERLIDSCLHCSHPDLLIRTSGEVRFSDFLLWQSSYCCVNFTPVLWPEFDIWSMLKALIYYQRNFPHLVKLREKHRKLQQKKLTHNERVDVFLERLESERSRNLIHISPLRLPKIAENAYTIP